MNKKLLYVVPFLVLLCTGCQTLKGAANGFNQDVHNLLDPDKNGCNAIQRADAWMQEHMW